MNKKLQLCGHYFTMAIVAHIKQTYFADCVNQVNLLSIRNTTDFVSDSLDVNLSIIYIGNCLMNFIGA